MDDGALRTAARDTRRLGIVEVAREVFMAEGFADASMSAIAARVGGSKGTLYNYFPSKEGLFAAVIQDACDRKQATLFDSLNVEGETVEAVLSTVGRRYAAIVLSDDMVELNRMVIAEAQRFPELGRILFEAGPKRGRARMTAYVEAEMAAGRLRPDDAGRMVDQFCEMCLRGLHRLRLMKAVGPLGEAEIAANVDAAVRVILSAYGAPGARG